MVQVKGIARLLTHRFNRDFAGNVKYSTLCPSRIDSPCEASRAMPTSGAFSESGSKGRRLMVFAFCSPSYPRKWSPSRQNRALYNRRQREHNSYACRIDFLEIRQPIPIFAMKALPVPFLRLLRSIAATLALLWVISVFAASQDSSPKATPGQTTAVVNVNEVSLNMVVRDRKGKLVSDLKPEDIAVTDGNSPVKISNLRLVTGDRGEHLLTMVFDRMDSSAGHNARDIAGKILKMMPPD